MKAILFGLGLGAAVVAATSAPANAKLVLRQDAFNTTRFGECQTECTGWANLETTCEAAGQSGNETAVYACVCNREFFESAQTCGICAPQAFADASIVPGLDGFVEVGVATCNENGFQVVLGTASSGPNSGSPRPTPDSDTDGNSTESTVTNTLVAPTTRPNGPDAATSALSSGGSSVSSSASSAAASATSSPAPAGAASHLQVASGLFTLAVAAGIYVLV